MKEYDKHFFHNENCMTSFFCQPGDAESILQNFTRAHTGTHTQVLNSEGHNKGK